MNNPLFQPIYRPGAAEFGKNKQAPSFSETMSSAFQLENDVVNVLDYMTRPVYEPDPNFDFFKTFKERQLPIEWMPLVANSQSTPEFEANVARLQKEYKNKAVLAASGWTGTVAALSAGILSPTIFIPFTGQAKGGMAIGQMLGLAAAGATAQNVALFLNQETRTEAEFYTGVAMDTLLMGMMGGAYFTMSKAGRAQLAGNLPYRNEVVQAPVGSLDVPGRAGEEEIDTNDVLMLTPEMRVQDVLQLTPDMRVADLLRLTADMEIKPYQLTREMRTDVPYLLKLDQRVDGPLMLTEKERVPDGTMMLTPDMRVQDLLMLTPDMRVADVLKLTEDMRVDLGPPPVETPRLELSTIRRVRAKSMEEQVAYGGSFLEAAFGDNLRVRFTKASAGSKWFVGGEYAISLHRADGTEIRIDRNKADSFSLQGNTMIYKEKELKEALARGELNEQIENMLRVSDEPGMAPTRREEAISNLKGGEARAAGAAPSRARNTLGAKAAPNRARQLALDTLGKISPAYRMLTQPFFPSLRDAIAKLDTAGIQQAGLESMEPSASGGPGIERIRGYDRHIVEFARQLDQNYYEYLYGKQAGSFLESPAFAQIKSMIGKQPAGKMDWVTYKAAVFDALNTGKIPDELANSVEAFKRFFEFYTARQKQYLQEFERAGIEVDPLFKELAEEELGEGVVNYAHHIFDQTKLMERMSEFIEDFAAKYEKQLTEDFVKARQKYAKRKEKLEFERLVGTMTPEGMALGLEAVEADIAFIDELPEMINFRDGRLELNKQARDEGWSKEQLKEAQKEWLDSQGDAVKELLEERKQFMAIAKVYKKFGGDASEKTKKLQDELAKLNENISSMFRTLLPQVQRADLSIAAIQKQGDKALAKAEGDLAKVIKEMQKRNAQMQKLLASKRTNTATREKMQAQLDALRLKHAGMLERLSAVQGQGVALTQRLRELQLIREDAIADATVIVKGRAVRADDIEGKLEEVKASVLTPEDRARLNDQIGEELWKLESDFQQKWGRKGETSGDPLTTGAPDFRDKAVEMATLLHQKLTNAEVELSPAYHALRQDARGAELLRVMKLPYEMKQKWLVKDVELVTRAYDRVMAPDLELWRAFEGSPNGKSVLAQMQQEVTAHNARIATAKYVKLPKGWVDKAAKFSERVAKRLAEAGEADDIYLDAKNFSDEPKEGFIELTPELRSQLGQAVHDAAKAYTHDFDVAVQRLRNTRGVPRDAKSWWWRGGRMVKNLNVMTMMGGVLTSSISDVARPIWQHGAGKVFRFGWAPFINKLNPEAKAFRLRSQEINRQIGLNLEPVLHGRAQAVFDLAEDSIGKTRLERGINVGAQKMGLIALYDYWTAGMKTIAGNVTHATMATYIPEVAKAWRNNIEPTGDLLQMRTYLRNLGLRDLDIHRIALQMEKADGMETFSNGGVLPNLDKWDDPVAYQAYQAAVLGEVNKLIVTPGLERPDWVDENMAYSMLAQFRSFVFASNSRIAMSGLQGNDPYLIQGVAFSLAFGALSYYTYAVTAGGKTYERMQEMSLEDWMWEAVKRSGILGALSIAGDAGEQIPLISGDDTNPMFLKPSGLLGTFLGPTYSQLEKVATVLSTAGAEYKTEAAEARANERNMKLLRQVFVPFQNHFLFRQLFDRAGEALYGAE